MPSKMRLGILSNINAKFNQIKKKIKIFKHLKETTNKKKNIFEKERVK